MPSLFFSAALTPFPLSLASCDVADGDPDEAGGDGKDGHDDGDVGGGEDEQHLR